MTKAWKEIKQHFNVSVALDLYQVGLIFLNPEIYKQEYALEL